MNPSGPVMQSAIQAGLSDGAADGGIAAALFVMCLGVIVLGWWVILAYYAVKRKVQDVFRWHQARKRARCFRS